MKKQTKKDFVNLFLSIFLIYLIFYIGIYIHELSHCIAFELVGGECKKVHIDMERGYCKGSCPTIEGCRITLIAGSVGAIFFGFLLVVIAHNLEKYSICIGGYSIILHNIFYWIISPTLKMGDFYDLIQTYESLNPEPILKMLWIFFILIWILFISSLKKIHKNRKV